MKTLKIIRIIGAVVLGAASVYFLLEGDYVNAGFQFVLCLLLCVLFYSKIKMNSSNFYERKGMPKM